MPDPGHVVALGGGHGLSATLRALKKLTDDTTAIVTVADDGGSSGRLRREFDVVPFGDLRMAICALASDHMLEKRLDDFFQHRFQGSGVLAGHAVGNLILTALWEMTGDVVKSLELAGKALGITGRVLPVSSIPLDIEADVFGLEGDPRAARKIIGQAAVGNTPGTIRRVRLCPPNPPVLPEVLEALSDANVITIGPGSWFTSVMPNLLIPEIVTAINTSGALRVGILNLVPQPGETAGFSAERHLHLLRQHVPTLKIDVFIVDEGVYLSESELEHLQRSAADFGARLVVEKVAATQSNGRIQDVHDPTKLAEVLRKIYLESPQYAQRARRNIQSHSKIPTEGRM